MEKVSLYSFTLISRGIGGIKGDVRASNVHAQYCYDRVVFFYRRPFFNFLLPLLLPIPFTVKTYARGAICYSFFFYP